MLVSKDRFPKVRYVAYPTHAQNPLTIKYNPPPPPVQKMVEAAKLVTPITRWDGTQ